MEPAATDGRTERDALLTSLAAALDGGRVPVAVLLLDVDRLRTINEGLGWEAGDAVLASVIAGIREVIGDADEVRRLGGDEFGIVCTDVGSAEEGAALATRIMWRAGRDPRIGERILPVRVSIGFVVATDGDRAADTLIEDAGIALYAAKADGGGTVMRFSENLRQHGRDRFLIEDDLHIAVEQGAFQLHYQGQVALSSLEVVGAEALIRWPHAERGWISPATFIPIAEETGLILPIGHWVMRTAALQAAHWAAAGHDLDISINVAAAQLAQPDLLFQVREVLRESGASPHLLTVEVTESQVMRNLDVALPAMRALQQLGIRLSIDDFGTGYASLTQLKRVPANELKLDIAFIRDLPGETADRAIVRAAIEMAHALNMKVVAEGVETREQLEVLGTLGCDIIQGFLLTRPVPAARMPFGVQQPATV